MRYRELANWAKLLTSLIKDDINTYRDNLPDILKSPEWQMTGKVLEKHLEIDPDYAVGLNLGTGRIRIARQAGKNGRVPQNVCNEIYKTIEEVGEAISQATPVKIWG